jgi:F-type H+-transporting ATPase subunit b
VRFSSRIAWLGAAAFLFAALAVAPFGARAQQPASATQAAQAATAPASAAQNAAKSGAAQEAPKSEQDESDRYRHAPVVQSLARVLHLNVETTARLAEFINFGIIFLLVAIPLGRMMPKVMRQRRQTLSHNLETAREVTADANKRLSAVEARLSGLDEEIANFRAQVEAESKNDEVRIKASLDEESARIVASAEQELTQAAAQARRELRNYATELAIEQASRQLVLSPETDRALIAEFIGDVAKEGKN